MRYNALFLAALSLECALAQPAHHRHHHKQRRDLANVDWNSVNYGNVDVSGVDFTKVNYGNGAPANSNAVKQDQKQQQDNTPPVKAPAPKVVNVIPVPVADTSKQVDTSQKADTSQKTDTSQKADTSDQSSGSGIVPGATGGASGGKFGGRTAGHQGDNKDLYIGNMGVPFGSNMMLVNTQNAQQNNKYTITFKNNGQNDIKVIVWQNPGRDGSPLGGKGEDPVISIPLGHGQSQAVAFDEDTHGAFSLDCARGGDGSTTCARGEYNFGDQCPSQWDNVNGSQGWSGFDRSTIMGGNGDNLDLSCLNCGSGGSQMSAKGKNEFTSDKQTSSGGAILPGPAHILAVFS
ncbi:MAG: hypothetical protein LQ350_002543 [Teloschistes chrysophthalmus]|nr:MAG: hypothetical protein LQ350_002543 [Niorma chrysophthalma]